MSTNERREHIIDDVVSYLTLSEWDKKIGKSKIHNLSLSHFSEAEAMVGHGEVLHDDEWRIFEDVTPQALNNKYDISIITAGQPEDPEKDYKFCLSRVMPISAHACRGLITKFYPTLCNVSMGIIHHDGTYFTARDIMGYLGNHKWVSVFDRGTDDFNRQFIRDKESTQEINVLINTSLGIQFTRRYWWRTVIGVEGYGSVSLSVRPEACQEIFRLRDIPEGKQRRAALRNWISSHWRVRSEDPNAAVRVRKHLRGETSFRWNGLDVKIVPSEFDLELNQKIALLRRAPNSELIVKTGAK